MTDSSCHCVLYLCRFASVIQVLNVPLSSISLTCCVFAHFDTFSVRQETGVPLNSFSCTFFLSPLLSLVKYPFFLLSIVGWLYLPPWLSPPVYCHHHHHHQHYHHPQVYPTRRSLIVNWCVRHCCCFFFFFTSSSNILLDRLIRGGRRQTTTQVTACTPHLKRAKHLCVRLLSSFDCLD